MRIILKRYISLILLLAVCFSMIPASASAEFTDNEQAEYAFIGCGTSGSPWEISTQDDLITLARLVNSGDALYSGGYYILTDSITVPDAWTPIGTAEYPFRGNFNGDGKKLRGLTTDCGSGYFGLFGVTDGAQISKVGIEDVSIQSDSYEAVSAIVGLMQGGTLSESYITGYITNNSGIAGGLVAVLDGGVIENCYCDADITGYEIAGGIAGRALNDSSIRCCYASGWMETTSWIDCCGSITGSNEGAFVCNCIAVQGIDYDCISLSGSLAGDLKYYESFDFTNIWISDGFSAPELLNNPETECFKNSLVCSGSGTVYRALLIGQTNYETHGSTADNLASDTEVAIIKTFLENSADDWIITLVEDRTKSEIVSDIKTAFADSDDDDVNLFYFAGHGVQVSNYTTGKSRVGMLTGIDSTGYEYQCIKSAELEQIFRQIPGHFYVLLASCFSGIFIQDYGLESDLVSAFAEGEENLILPDTSTDELVSNAAELANSKYSVIACAAYNQSGWSYKGHPSFYSLGLCEAVGLNYSRTTKTVTDSSVLNGDTDSDGLLTFYEAFCYARDYVNNILSKYSKVQDVQVYPDNCLRILYRKNTDPTPFAPVVSVATENDIMRLSWELVSYASEYTIYRADSIDGDYIKIGSSESDYYIDDSAVEGNTYYYKVTAVSSTGKESESSDSVSGCIAILGSGSCGDSVTWFLTAGGTLTVSGTGSMYDYTAEGAKPWYDIANETDLSDYIKYIVFSGVSHVGNYCFSLSDGIDNLVSVSFDSAVTDIGEGAFNNCEMLNDVYYDGTRTKWDSIDIGDYNTCLIDSEIHVEYYQISYNANGGTGAPDIQIIFSGESAAVSSLEPVMEGYTFLGWDDNPETAIPQYHSGDIYSKNEDIILYAAWSEFAYGDVNNDGSVDVYDTYTLRRAAAGLITLEESQLVISDLYSDGKYNSLDVNTLRRFLAGYISKIPYYSQ